ncbi:MAG TPA: sugar transferase [Myxococcales bacterium]|jgi:lipopolysaccharide/colanic/teichoic acid biosynthesis glycosyltransferase|nr:sugar transferase [Myxococcales bacterium]HBU48994.1 sugar transferase [Myxococcales bacterium]
MNSEVDRALKRALDLAFAGGALALSWPAFLALAAVIKWEDGGSALYVQERVGRFGRPFRLFKFRTMRQRAVDAAGLPITVGDDDRVTRVGRFLRRTRLDELPQLLNILRGEMSVVGPRPEVSRYVALYSDEQRAVLEVKPGLTDPATLAFRGEADVLGASEDPERTYIEIVMPEKLAMNLEYLRQRDVGSDLSLILQTVLTLASDELSREGEES